MNVRVRQNVKIAQLPHQMLDSQYGLCFVQLLGPRRTNDKEQSKVFYPPWKKWLASHPSTGYDSTDCTCCTLTSDSRKPYIFSQTYEILGHRCNLSNKT
jgi:hypothetical protein